MGTGRKISFIDVVGAAYANHSDNEIYRIHPL